MANFLDSTAEVEARIREYAARLHTIEAHVRRGERRAARARLDGFLEELIDFANEVELPVETMIVGAQLGFFSGGELLRGRLPATVIGMAAGWLYGQQTMRRSRLALEEIAEGVAMLMLMLEAEPDPPAEVAAGTADDLQSPEIHDRVTAEIDRNQGNG